MSTSASKASSDPSRCPHCGSSLEGVESATCPHCGRLLPSQSDATPPERRAASQEPRPPVGTPPPAQVAPVDVHSPAAETPPTVTPQTTAGASERPPVIRHNDQAALTPEEKARLQTKVRIAVACFSALILLATYLLLLALSR